MENILSSESWHRLKLLAFTTLDLADFISDCLLLEEWKDRTELFWISISIILLPRIGTAIWQIMNFNEPNYLYAAGNFFGFTMIIQTYENWEKSGWYDTPELDTNAFMGLKTLNFVFETIPQTFIQAFVLFGDLVDSKTIEDITIISLCISVLNAGLTCRFLANATVDCLEYYGGTRYFPQKLPNGERFKFNERLNSIMPISHVMDTIIRSGSLVIILKLPMPYALVLVLAYIALRYVFIWAHKQDCQMMAIKRILYAIFVGTIGDLTSGALKWFCGCHGEYNLGGRYIFYEHYFTQTVAFACTLYAIFGEDQSVWNISGYVLIGMLIVNLPIQHIAYWRHVYFEPREKLETTEAGGEETKDEIEC